MVFKDAVGSKLAQIELAEIEKQFLNTLKSNNPKKKVNHIQIPLQGVIEEKPQPTYFQYKPQEMHCLKKLLEQDYSLYEQSEITANCDCAQHKGASPEVFDEAMTKYVHEEYHKFLSYKQDKEQKKAALIAQGFSVDHLSDSEADESDEEMSSEDDDGAITPQVNINII